MMPLGGGAEPWDVGMALLKGTEPAKAHSFVLFLFLLHLHILFISLGYSLLNKSSCFFLLFFMEGETEARRKVT